MAPADAFYTFKGFLGARRRLPGRSGPPGADYNTLPRFKPLAVQFAISYWRDGSRADLARLKAGFVAPGTTPPRVETTPFWANLACRLRKLAGCQWVK